jgi:hypothetical protein
VVFDEKPIENGEAMTSATRMLRIPFDDIVTRLCEFPIGDGIDAIGRAMVERRLKRMLAAAGFDINQPITHWDDYDRGAVVYSQTVDIPAPADKLESKGVSS